MDVAIFAATIATTFAQFDLTAPTEMGCVRPPSPNDCTDRDCCDNRVDNFNSRIDEA